MLLKRDGFCLELSVFWGQNWGHTDLPSFAMAVWSGKQHGAGGENLSGALLSPQNTAFLTLFTSRKLCITCAETVLFLTRQRPTAKKLHVKPTVCVRKLTVAHPEVPLH